MKIASGNWRSRISGAGNGAGHDDARHERQVGHEAEQARAQRVGGVAQAGVILPREALGDTGGEAPVAGAPIAAPLTPSANTPGSASARQGPGPARRGASLRKLAASPRRPRALEPRRAWRSKALTAPPTGLAPA